MTDFLDRYGAQLRAAERALSNTTVSARRPRRRLTRRTALIVLGCSAIAVPAVAATLPWQPILGRPELHDVPNGTSPTAPPRRQLGEFAVLRRRQNAQDRGATAQALLRRLGPEEGGIRLRTVRLLTAASGRQALLVATATAGLPDGPVVDKMPDELCLLDSTGGLCGSGPDLLKHGLLGYNNGMMGLVPDGVTTILFTYPGGGTYKTVVEDNFFWIPDTPTRRLSAPSAPGVSPVLEPSQPNSIQWLDPGGQVVGSSFTSPTGAGHPPRAATP